jgi:hypothetical protein
LTAALGEIRSFLYTYPAGHVGSRARRTAGCSQIGDPKTMRVRTSSSAQRHKKGAASTKQRLQWERYEICKPVLGRLSMASPWQHRPLTQKARGYGQKAPSREVRSAPEFRICLRSMRMCMRTGLRLLYHNPASSPVYESYPRPHTPRSFTCGTYPTTISPLGTHDQLVQPPSFVAFSGLRYVHVTCLRGGRVGSASPPLNVRMWTPGAPRSNVYLKRIYKSPPTATDRLLLTIDRR